MSLLCFLFGAVVDVLSCHQTPFYPQVFEELGLHGKLMPVSIRRRMLPLKRRADIVEAIIGELAVRSSEYFETSAQIVCSIEDLKAWAWEESVELSQCELAAAAFELLLDYIWQWRNSHKATLAFVVQAVNGSNTAEDGDMPTQKDALGPPGSELVSRPASFLDNRVGAKARRPDAAEGESDRPASHGVPGPPRSISPRRRPTLSVTSSCRRCPVTSRLIASSTRRP